MIDWVILGLMGLSHQQQQRRRDTAAPPPIDLSILCAGLVLALALAGCALLVLVEH